MTDKPLRPKDHAAIGAWIGGATLTQAWRDHVATNPEAKCANQAATRWAKQPHIVQAVRSAREEVIAIQYGDTTALIATQLSRLERIFAEGLTLRPDAQGVLRPENLPAALGAVLGINKLFQTGAQANMSKLAQLRIWHAVQADLGLSHETRAAIETTIMRGGVL